MTSKIRTKTQNLHDLFQEEFKTTLKYLQEKLKIFKDCELNWTQTSEYIKVGINIMVLMF